MAEPTSSKKYDALVFDLDDTLFNTTHQCVAPAAHQAFEAMIAAGLQATLQECTQAHIEFSKRHPTPEIFSGIARKFGAGANVDPNELAAIGLKIYYEHPLPETLIAYPGVRETLSEVSASYMTFLVTMGRLEIQKQKVHMLRVSHFFRGIFYVDPSDKLAKSRAFGSILLNTGLKPNRCLSIGNRLDLEIAQAKSLGMDTCFVVTERHRSIPERREEQPDYKIGRISEIMKVCQL